MFVPLGKSSPFDLLTMPDSLKCVSQGSAVSDSELVAKMPALAQSQLYSVTFSAIPGT